MIFVDSESGKVDIFSTVLQDCHQNLEQRSISRKNYIICFTERSGSTMLCSLLKETGVLGMPEEYINPRDVMQSYLEKYRVSDISQYINILRHCQVCENGIFGMKTCFMDFEPLINQQIIGRSINPVKFIYLTRQDIILQAISAHVARSSGVWHVAESGIAEPECEYDETAILNHVDRLLYERSQWERFFSFYSVEPLRITYEEVLENVEGVIKKILSFLGEDVQINVALSMAATQKIGGERNQAWADRIRSKYVL